MGKGGYNGGSSVVGFSGSGWVGRGSVTMQTASKKGGGKASAKRKPAKGKTPIIPADLAGDEELQRILRRMKAVEVDIASAKRRMDALRNQLSHVQTELKLSIAAKRPPQIAKARRGR